MCNNVVVQPFGPQSLARVASNQGELVAIIGRDNLVMDIGGVAPAGTIYEGAEFCPEDCLCPVNMPASAAKAGYEHSSRDADGDHDPFDYHWRKLP